MNEWTVLSSLREIAVLEENALSDALPLCRSAMDAVLQRMKADADPADSRLIRAAAGIAYYKWVLRQSFSDDGIQSFKAGDVTISRSDASAMARAEKYRNDAIIDALPLFKDENFLFCSV